MDDNMMCNYKKCKKRLTSFAWVTSCSHIFCDEDGTREFNKTLICPACETNLHGKFDIIRADLSPSDQYKSMVLAGQKPEVIIEIASRSLAFWTYQIHQERVYQEYVSNKSKEKMQAIEQYYEEVITKIQSELMSLKTQVSVSKKEGETLKKRLKELSDAMAERSRQYQKLQGMYDAIKRRNINPSNLDDATTRGSGPRPAPVGQFPMMMPIPFDRPLHNSGPSPVPMMRSGGGDDRPMNSRIPPEREFWFQPEIVPQCSPCHDQSISTVQNRFNLDLGTPNSLAKRPVQRNQPGSR